MMEDMTLPREEVPRSPDDGEPIYTVTVIDLPLRGAVVNVAVWEDVDEFLLSPAEARRFAADLVLKAELAERGSVFKEVSGV